MVLAFFDFVPVLAFYVGTRYLIRWARLFDRRDISTGMMVGSILAVIGGATKAIWKLLVTMDLGDVVWLGEAQFALLAPGFFLMFVSALGVLFQENKTIRAGLGAMALWKIPLLAFMTLSSLGLYGVLGFLGWRKKNYLVPVLYAITVICTIGLAGMATQAQNITQQWLEEGVNAIGQIAFVGGSYRMCKDYE
ncbi:MAG: hypothetical protein JW757_02535 [Anaerolineales bacterium]|nr:hypothetical protein [Anaerolineales bacterium]